MFLGSVLKYVESVGAHSPSPMELWIIMFYVYILQSNVDKSIYIGYTDDLRRRFKEHNNLEVKSTKNKAPYGLIYYEAYKSKSDAKYRENNLKRFAKAYGQLKRRIKNSIDAP